MSDQRPSGSVLLLRHSKNWAEGLQRPQDEPPGPGLCSAVGGGLRCRGCFERLPCRHLPPESGAFDPDPKTPQWARVPCPGP